MSSHRSYDAQLLLPGVEFTEAAAELMAGARRSGVARSRAEARSARARPTQERPGVRAAADPPNGQPGRALAVHGDRLLITVPEAAHVLHIGRRQAWELVWRGELTVVRLGRSVRVARPVLERFVAERSAPYST
jgi:excisionase family DNA binding protein